MTARNRFLRSLRGPFSQLVRWVDSCPLGSLSRSGHFEYSRAACRVAVDFPFLIYPWLSSSPPPPRMSASFPATPSLLFASLSVLPPTLLSSCRSSTQFSLRTAVMQEPPASQRDNLRAAPGLGAHGSKIDSRLTLLPAYIGLMSLDFRLSTKATTDGTFPFTRLYSDGELWGLGLGSAASDCIRFRNDRTCPASGN